MAFILTLLLSFLQFQADSNTFLEQTEDSLIIRNWSVKDGLPVNTVNSIVQDKDDYIWFTTYDGIVRFDGIKFEVFIHSNTPEMPQNRAVFLHLQENGNMWVTLENGGVLLIKGTTFQHFNEEAGFTSGNTSNMMEDSKGRMWFSTFNGLYKYEDGKFSKAFERETQEKNRVVFTYEDIDGSIWAATGDGLVHLREDKTTIYNVEAGTNKNSFQRIIRTPEGELLVGTMQGLYVLQNGKLTIPEKFEGLKDKIVPYFYADDKILLISSEETLFSYNSELKALTHSSNKSFWRYYRDSSGILWMINTRGQLAQIQNGEYRSLRNVAPYSSFYINELVEDHEQNMWFSTARNGIIRVKNSRVKTIDTEDGLSGENILGLFEDSKGRFWVGTRDFGLNKIEGNKITHYRQNDGIAKDIVHSITEDKEGNIWVGYYQGGVEKFTKNGTRLYDLGFVGGANDVRSVFVRQDSSVWIGSYGGLIKLDQKNENHQVFTESEGMAGELVRYLDEDETGGLWIATMDGGVSYLKDSTFTNYTTDNGLSSNNIRSVYVDEFDQNTIWVGTENNGLNRIRDGQISYLSVDEGLPDHVIHFISQDEFGWLWMSSNKGVFKILKEELNAFLDDETDYFTMVHFGKEDGMKNPEANGSFQQGGLRTSNGTFWIATQEGIAIFQIQPRQINNTPPKVLIENIRANGKVYSGGKIVLENGVKGFRTNFHALTYVAPEKTRFRYKLDGYDAEWKEVLNIRSVSYNNLSAGTYTFRVTASNNDGIWSNEEATAAITIQPLFYEQFWFYICLLALLGFGSYGFSRLRYSYLLNQQEKLKKVIEEQTAELRKEKNELRERNLIIEEQALKLEESNRTKDKFFSIIAHDLRNPFQAILGYSDLLLMKFEDADPAEVKNGLEMIKNSSKSLFNLVINLLEWSSLQSGKMNAEPESLVVDQIIERNIDLFQQTAQQKNITLTYSFSGKDGIQVYVDRNMLDTILRNLISNAIKFTPKGGKVNISISKDAEHGIIKVEDNGIGMPENMVQKLMHLDSKSSRTGTNDEKGTGLGLLICHEMLALNNGELHIESKENQGTVFTILLPLK